MPEIALPKHLIHHHIYQEVVHQNQHILLGKVLPSMSTTVVRVRASCLLCFPSWVFKVLVKWFVHHSAVINGTPWNILSPSNISNNLVYLHHAKKAKLKSGSIYFVYKTYTYMVSPGTLQILHYITPPSLPVLGCAL